MSSFTEEDILRKYDVGHGNDFGKHGRTREKTFEYAETGTGMQNDSSIQQRAGIRRRYGKTSGNRGGLP